MIALPTKRAFRAARLDVSPRWAALEFRPGAVAPPPSGDAAPERGKDGREADQPILPKHQARIDF